MYHPNMTGSVEEGLITSFGFTFGGRNQTLILDEMVVTVQNTGDLPITATGGFLNGNAAMKVSQGASIERGSTGKVTLYFPHYAVWDLVMGTQPYRAKIVTTRDNVIAYPDTYYPPRNDLVDDVVTVDQQAEITNLQFTLGEGSDQIIATIQNTGFTAINLTSSLLNGKVRYFVPNTLLIPPNETGTVTLPLDPGTLIDSETYQLVLITSESNAFIRTAVYNRP